MFLKYITDLFFHYCIKSQFPNVDVQQKEEQMEEKKHKLCYC